MNNRQRAPSRSLSSLPQFDPRTVPTVAQRERLGAVAPHALTPAALRQRFAQPPSWQPEPREQPWLDGQVPAAAAVLVPIVTRARPSVLLTQRTSHLSTHSGQIAFPGGKVDAHDIDPTATALRETLEETGLAAAYVEVLGSLPSYTTVSAFDITPVVALVRPGFQLSPNANEVADVFEVPLDFLMDPSNHRLHALLVDDVRREWFSMPYDGQGTERFIWGVTAAILRNFYRFLRA